MTRAFWYALFIVNLPDEDLVGYIDITNDINLP